MLDVKAMSTEALEQFILAEYEKCDEENDTELLFAVLEELSRRREAAGVVIKSAEEAHREFVKHYMPVDPTPSYHGMHCLANGSYGADRRCDACDHWHTCYPEWPHISQERAEFIIRNCVANARFEGQMCDAEDVAAIRRILSGETTLEQELDALEEKYRALAERN